MRIGISGYRGKKTDNGYQVPVPLLQKGYKFLVEKGLPELGVNEITTITVSDDTGSDIIGLKLAKEFNAAVTIKKPQWDNFNDPKEAAKDRYREVVENSDVFVLFKNEKYFGGDAIIEELAKKSKLKILIYDFSTDGFFVTTGKKLLDDLANELKKIKTPSIDYARIARSLLSRKCILIDTETTGTGMSDEVIEIAVVDGNSGHVYFQSKIKASIPSSPGAVNVHGIKDTDLVDCPTIDEIYPALERFFDYPIVAYNAPFDYRLLDQSLRKKGIELPVHRFEDAMLLCSAKFGERKKLEDVCIDLGIEPGHHSAAGDTIALWKVLKELAKDKTDLEKQLEDELHTVT